MQRSFTTKVEEQHSKSLSAVLFFKYAKYRKNQHTQNSIHKQKWITVECRSLKTVQQQFLQNTETSPTYFSF